MIAVKGNKVYTIVDENQKNLYLKEGYDIKDDKGNVVQYNPNKKVPYSEYVALEEENKKLKVEIAKLKKANKEEKGDK